MRVLLGKLVIASLLAAATAERGGAEAQHFWPQWRGPLGTGVAPDAQPPVTWSETKHVRWKTALPGKGHSTPIVWGEHSRLNSGPASRSALSERLAPHHERYSADDLASPATAKAVG